MGLTCSLLRLNNEGSIGGKTWYEGAINAAIFPKNVWNKNNKILLIYTLEQKKVYRLNKLSVWEINQFLKSNTDLEC